MTPFQHEREVQELCNPALESRHWKSIMSLIGADSIAESAICLNACVDAGIEHHMESVSTISAAASKEASMRSALDSISQQWVAVSFTVVPFKDTGVCILAGVDDIQQLLDDHALKVQAMAASPFAEPVRQPLDKLQHMLNNLQDVLDQWLACQSTWMYLEPIFSSDDIVKQMPTEGQKFRQVDGQFRSFMGDVQHNPGAAGIGESAEILEVCPFSLPFRKWPSQRCVYKALGLCMLMQRRAADSAREQQAAGRYPERPGIIPGTQATFLPSLFLPWQ